MALPSLSQRTPRESPTLATVNSLSDSRATRHVVPKGDGAERVNSGDQRKEEKMVGNEMYKHLTNITRLWLIKTCLTSNIVILYLQEL